MAAGASTSTSLEHTPTWALATVCFCFASISILIEHSIDLLTEWLKRHRKTALYEAVSSLKSVLMFLGFMSLILAVTQDYITKICIPYKAATTMLPCRGQVVVRPGVESFVINAAYLNTSSFHYSTNSDDDDQVYYNETAKNAKSSDACGSKGMVSLMTNKGIQQLQIFIFVLAVMQIVYSVLTLGLGRLKMRRWTAWEKETQTLEYQVGNDPNRFRFTRETTFGRRHENCTETGIQLWIAHLSERFHNFNFQQYIESSLDEDFKVVVSISPLLWFLVVIFMLVDVYGWHSYLWLSHVPLIIMLVLGTKLEVIVAKMALQLKTLNNVTMGAPLVQPNDKYFWFGKPKFVLHLLHLTLFVNAFEFAFFLWVTIQFGYHSCHHEHNAITITRIVLAVSVQVLCSYITLPLYALVTQMGSQFKGELINDHLTKVLKQWHAEVREKRKKREHILAQFTPTTVASERGPDNSCVTVKSWDQPCLMKQITYRTYASEITEEEEEEELEEEEERAAEESQE